MGRSQSLRACLAADVPQATPWQQLRAAKAFLGTASWALAENFSYASLIPACNENCLNPKVSHCANGVSI